MENKRLSVFHILNGFFLSVFTLLVLYPIYQCVIISLNNGTDLTFNGVVYLWPRVFSLESYRKVFEDTTFLLAARNSILRTVLGTVVAIIITSTYAYVISRKDFLFRKFLSGIGLVTMYFSGGLIPTFLLIRSIGLYDNFMVYIFTNAFSMFNCLVFITYFRGIPNEVEESAKIDGANDLIIFLKIIAPISKPVFACISLFVAVGQWNDYFDCMIYTRNESLTVLSFLFAKMLLAQQYLESMVLEMSDLTVEEIIAIRGPVSTLTLQMATMVVTIVPIIMIYPFLQRYFVKGIMIGSVKG